MKNPFHYIQQYPKRTKQLLGISHEQFQQLLVQAEARHRQQQAAREKNKVRLNAQGGGCKPKLSKTNWLRYQKAKILWMYSQVLADQ